MILTNVNGHKVNNTEMDVAQALIERKNYYGEIMTLEEVINLKISKNDYGLKSPLALKRAYLSLERKGFMKDYL